MKQILIALLAFTTSTVISAQNRVLLRKDSTENVESDPFEKTDARRMNPTTTVTR